MTKEETLRTLKKLEIFRQKMERGDMHGKDFTKETYLNDDGWYPVIRIALKTQARREPLIPAKLKKGG